MTLTKLTTCVTVALAGLLYPSMASAQDPNYYGKVFQNQAPAPASLANQIMRASHPIPEHVQCSLGGPQRQSAYCIASFADGQFWAIFTGVHSVKVAGRFEWYFQPKERQWETFSD